jgi:hypothetical protein
VISCASKSRHASWRTSSTPEHAFNPTAPLQTTPNRLATYAGSSEEITHNLDRGGIFLTARVSGAAQVKKRVARMAE